MTTPFFSVVIPTKNRSFLVGLAIQSVLRQSFGDFEIVVADNDDTDATRPVIESFNDPRIHCHRTGGLSMPDNWEFAVSQAQGEYVTILEDKQVLRKHALERIFKEVETARHPVVSWLYDRYYDTEQPPKIIKKESRGDAVLIPSQRIIEAFIHQGRSGECDRVLPRGLNSCTHRTLINQIRSGPARRLCLHVTPDFSMGFQQLAYCDSILHIDEALVVVGGFRYSTGRTIKVNKDALLYFQGSDWDDGLFYNRVPVKAFTIAGSLYNDYENVRLLVGGNLSPYPLDMKSYFIQCYKDIQYSRKMGAEMSGERTEWARALSQQEPSCQASVYHSLLTEESDLDISLSARLSELSARIIKLETKLDYAMPRLTELKKLNTALLNLWPVRLTLFGMKLLGIPLSKDHAAAAPSDPEPAGSKSNKSLGTLSNAFEYILWEETQQG